MKTLPTCLGFRTEKSVVWCADKCPFASPLLSSPAFLALLTPMVKQLSLCGIPTIIGPVEIAAICKLSNL